MTFACLNSNQPKFDLSVDAMHMTFGYIGTEMENVTDTVDAVWKIFWTDVIFQAEHTLFLLQNPAYEYL